LTFRLRVRFRVRGEFIVANAISRSRSVYQGPHFRPREVYVANSNPDGIDHDLEHRPLMAFTLCYIASHLALDLLGEEEAEKILNYCERRMERF
jgi:hypothetical protein